MAKPRQGAWKKMKRLARYLVGCLELEWWFGNIEEWELHKIDVFVDSDWAGCLKTRKSTSGGVVCLGGVGVKSWASTQATIATSSGEAEYYAIAKGAAEGLGMKAILKDLGVESSVSVYTDSTAAKGMGSRTGLGKMRHLEVKMLWIQEAVGRGVITLRKVDGKLNPADILTKPKGRYEIGEQLGRIGAQLVGKGRADNLEVGACYWKGRWFLRRWW